MLSRISRKSDDSSGTLKDESSDVTIEINEEKMRISGETPFSSYLALIIQENNTLYNGVFIGITLIVIMLSDTPEKARTGENMINSFAYLTLLEAEEEFEVVPESALTIGMPRRSSSESRGYSILRVLYGRYFYGNRIMHWMWILRKCVSRPFL